MKHGAESLSDGSPQLRALLRAGISDEVDYDCEKGLATHLAAIGVVPMLPHAGGAPGAATAGAPSLATGLSAKAMFALLGIPIASASVVAALWFGTGAHVASSSDVGAPKSAGAAAQVVDTSKSLVAAPASPEPAIAVPAPAQAAISDPSPRAPRTGARRHFAVTLAETPDVADAPNAPSTAETTQPEDGPAATTTVSASDAPSSPSATGSSTSENPNQPQPKPEDLRRQAQERLAREMDELVQAKHALSDDPAKALLLAERGQHEFPHGVFGEERQQILLLALIAVGRVDDARRLAAPYLQSHPDSPFARRVERALAGK